MVAGDDELEGRGDVLEELYGCAQLAELGVLGEIAAVDDDVGCWEGRFERVAVRV